MRRAVRNLPTAREELVAAISWYEEQQSGLGGELYDSIAEAIALVEAQPHVGLLDPTTRTRRVLVPRFPYQVVYYLTDDEIVIVAFAHSKRRPAYWHDRT